MSIYRFLLVLLIVGLLGNCKNNRPSTNSCPYIINDEGVNIGQADTICNALNALISDSLNLDIFIGDWLKNSGVVKAMDTFRTRFQVEKQCALFWNINEKDFSVIYSESLNADSLSQKRFAFNRFIYDRINRDSIENILIPVIHKFRELFTTPGLLNGEGTDIEK